MDWVKDYISRGWAVIPVPLKSKSPVLENWQKLRLKEEELSHYFHGQENVGILLGEPSKWLVDVDLDCEASMLIAPFILPPTLVFGHGANSKAKSHWLFRAKGAQTKKFIYDGKTYVELRSTGTQTLFPPSIHPSGETYQFANREDPYELSPHELERMCGLIAGLSIFAEFWPEEGSRQDCALALTGALARRGVNEDLMRSWLKIICQVAGDEEPKMRVAQIGHTVEKVRAGEPATGFPRLTEFIPEKAIKCAFSWLGLPESIEKKEYIFSDKFYPRPFSDEILGQYSFWYPGEKSPLYWFDLKEGVWRLGGEGLIENYLRTKTNSLDDIMKRTYIINEIVSDIKGISWKGEELPEPPPWLIPFRDGVYDLKTFQFRNFNKEDYFTWKLNWRYNSQARAKTLEPLIDSFLPEPTSLYELMAYCLWRGYPYQKIFFLFGRGSNGKTLFANILEKLLGPENVSHVSLKELQNSRFGGSQLYQKLANICGELEYEELKNTGLLKQLCGEDTIEADRKYLLPIKFKNYAKLIFLTNELPRSWDTTEAFYRRLFLIEFPKVFKEDPALLVTVKDLPEEEWEGLLFKTLGHLRNLMENNFIFRGDMGFQKTKELYLKLSSPLQQFVEENCVVSRNPQDFIFKYEFKERFFAWLGEKGRTTYTEKRLVKEMQELELPEMQKGEKRWWAWVGLKWKLNVKLQPAAWENSILVA